MRRKVVKETAQEYFRQRAVANKLGLSEKTIKRMRLAGEFPAPDMVVRGVDLWHWSTIQAKFGQRSAVAS